VSLFTTKIPESLMLAEFYDKIWIKQMTRATQKNPVDKSQKEKLQLNNQHHSKDVSFL
jgi:hypothetical protein